MASVPTVKIKDGKDFLTINESDYDPEKHTLYKGKTDADDEAADDAEAEAPASKGKKKG